MALLSFFGAAALSAVLPAVFCIFLYTRIDAIKVFAPLRFVIQGALDLGVFLAEAI